MIAELGNFALIIALAFALLQMILPCVSLMSPKQTQLNTHLAAWMTISQCLFLFVAMTALICCFITNDFTVIFVREHSHPLLPLFYKIGAAWGGHEGSLLLWCVVLSAWSALFSALYFKQRHHIAIYPLMLMILGVMSVGFIAFMLFTSNPFQRFFPAELIMGNDLTPLLQDPGLIFHPPMLYSGYVGFAVAFAFAVALLIHGKANSDWMTMIRPWVIVPWAMLSLGIVLGSAWAYRELGWGGWWFWDPVENASLLPWLCATALLHALIVCEKRNVFYGWMMLLCIVTFAFSLIGTFLVRSGVLVSVHSFAADPTRGLVLLIFLSLLIGGALTLFSFRIQRFFSPPQFSLFSRETILLMNTIFLLTAAATISLGTLYPIVLDALGMEKISVGEPYFNIIFLILMLPMLFIMGLSPHVKWQTNQIKLLSKQSTSIFLTSIVIALSFLIMMRLPFKLLTFIGLVSGVWIITSSLAHLVKFNINLSKSSMIVAHIGIAILALGITLNKSYSIERQVKMSPGDEITLANNQVRFAALVSRDHPNYLSQEARFTLNANNTIIAEDRVYKSHDQHLQTPGINVTTWRDIYIALGSQIKNDEWAVRLYYKPAVRWIWLGGILLMLGGLLSLLNHLKNGARA